MSYEVGIAFLGVETSGSRVTVSKFVHPPELHLLYTASETDSDGRI